MSNKASFADIIILSFLFVQVLNLYITMYLCKKRAKMLTKSYLKIIFFFRIKLVSHRISYLMELETKLNTYEWFAIKTRPIFIQTFSIDLIY